MRAAALHGAAYAGMRRSREKAPINPVFGCCLNCGDAGQPPVPYARDGRAGVQQWRGRSVNLRPPSYEGDDSPA